MIPLVDDYLQSYLVRRLKFLKENPEMIDQMFMTGRRETLSKLRTFILNSKFKVIIGYPKETSSLPCYVITLAPENEQPLALGDNTWTFDDYDLGMEDSTYTEDVEEMLRDHIAATYMNASYRIECWSDNGDLTSYMYIILKWALWSCRKDMLNEGWVNITLSGTDLEPVPDYMPVFIYRRASQISITYENKYYEDVDDLGIYLDVYRNPDKYHEDADGNIVDADGNIVIPHKFIWILKAHYYEHSVHEDGSEGSDTGGNTMQVEYVFRDDSSLQTSIRDSLPSVGRSNVRYLIAVKDKDGEISSYAEYVWVGGQFKQVGTSVNADSEKYATIEDVTSGDYETLEAANKYTDEEVEDVDTSEVGATGVNTIFNSIFK